MSVDGSTGSDPFMDLVKFGRFHLFQYVLVYLPLMMLGMVNVNYIFVAEDINYRCRVSECEEPHATVDTPNWWPEDLNTKCFRPIIDDYKFKIANNTCSNNTFIRNIENCREWIYENDNSIVSALNLGCQYWKTTLVGSIHNAGMVVSMLTMGWIADKFGRKPTVVFCSIAGVIGAVKILVTNYYVYLAIEFLESVLSSGLYTVAVVLLIEVGGESKRVLAGVIFSCAIYSGEVMFALVSMVFTNWKMLILVVYSPMILFITYLFLLRESVRWQMIRGKFDEAKKSLKLAAKFNKISVTPQEITNYDNKDLQYKFNVVVQIEKESVRDIISSKEMMIRLAVTSVCFFVSAFSYYGLMVHSVLLPGSKYINFVLASLASLPGDFLCLLTMNKFGRRISLRIGYLLSAVCLIVQTYLSDSITWLKILLFLLGKLGSCISLTGMYTYSMELFPTSVRGSTVGFGSTIARVGSTLAPLTTLLINYYETLPSILFAITSLVAACLLTFTPETKNLPLFDTIEQVEMHKSKTTVNADTKF